MPVDELVQVAEELQQLPALREAVGVTSSISAWSSRW